MTKIWKVALSVFSFFVVMLIAAAVMEAVFGSPRAGFVPMFVLLIEGPILFLIWRSGKSGEQKEELSREEIIARLRDMVSDPESPDTKREWAANRLRSYESLKR